MRLLFHFLNEADERPERVELLLETFGYLAALAVTLITLGVMNHRGAGWERQVGFVAVYVLVPVGCWLLRKPWLVGRLQLIGVVAAAALLIPPPLPGPDPATFKRDALDTLRGLDAARAWLGRYPPTLEAAGIRPPEAWWRTWWYHPTANGQNFQLGVGDVAKDKYQFYWDSGQRRWNEKRSS